jgi:preprotein translocase SecE subunit
MANPINASIDYVKSSLAELKEVTWPPRGTVIRHTIIVILAVGIAAGLVALVDAGLSALLELLLSRG